jgi:hypothetical protein
MDLVVFTVWPDEGPRRAHFSLDLDVLQYRATSTGHPSVICQPIGVGFEVF